MDSGGLIAAAAALGAMNPVDLLVGGAGPGGFALALTAADHGAHVRVIERLLDAFPTVAGHDPASPHAGVLRALGVTDETAG